MPNAVFPPLRPRPQRRTLKVKARLRHDDGVERYEIEDGFGLRLRYGSAEVRRETHGVVRVRYDGGITSEVCDAVAAFVDAEIARAGKLAFFIDAEQMKSYDSGFRKRWTQWLSERRSSLTCVRLLVTSRVVQMGITIVNPLVGNNLEAHTDRQSFERALAKARAGVLSSIEQGRL